MDPLAIEKSCLKCGQPILWDETEGLYGCECFGVRVIEDYDMLILEHDPDFWLDDPIIVCLCGSTRFWRAFQKAGLEETLAGKIVLSIGAASGTDDDHFGNLPRQEYDKIKAELDWLHLRKIDLADEVLILNVGGYIGDSTRREIEYAKQHRKKIRWLEQPGKQRKNQ